MLIGQVSGLGIRAVLVSLYVIAAFLEDKCGFSSSNFRDCLTDFVEFRCNEIVVPFVCPSKSVNDFEATIEASSRKLSTSSRLISGFHKEKCFTKKKGSLLHGGKIKFETKTEYLRLKSR